MKPGPPEIETEVPTTQKQCLRGLKGETVIIRRIQSLYVD
jgi:hypothetical protein